MNEEYLIIDALVKKHFPEKLALTTPEWELVKQGLHSVVKQVFEATKKEILHHDCLGVIYVNEIETIELEELEF